MESERFLEFIGDQFAKIFRELQKIKCDVQGIQDIQLRMENNLNYKLDKVYESTEVLRLEYESKGPEGGIID